MRNRVPCGGWLSVLLLLAQGAVAHEFWLEPVRYRIDAGDRISAHIRVGQHFSGNSQPYLPGNTESFSIDLAGTRLPATSRIGDIPALDQTVMDDGLAIVSHVSTDFTLVYREDGLFESFLAYEGLTPKLAEHKRRGLPMTGFKERYQRFAKALVKVGEGQGSDHRLGLRFEWVLEHNPYLSSDQPLRARLYWQGEALSGVQARLFIGWGGGSRVDEQVLTTDTEGRVTLAPPRGSRLMLNAVRLLEPEQVNPNAPDAVWKSYWSSISFAVP